MKQQKHNKGLTLVEILITVLILSIGLLGLAGLQVNSMKNNHSSYLRTQATIMAYDIIDRMRANPNAVTDTIKSYIATNNTPGVVTACTTDADTCTPTNMAHTDINQWRTELAAQLPGGLGAVCLDSSPDDGNDPSDAECSNSGDIYAIKIWWTDDRTATNPTLKRFVTSYAP